VTDLRRHFDSVYRRNYGATIIGRLTRQSLGDPATAAFEATGFLGPGDHRRFLEILDSSSGRVRRPLVLLDLGCGNARLGEWLAYGLRFDYCGIDFSTTAIRIARSLPRRNATRRRLLCTDFTDLRSIADEAAGTAFSLDSLYLAADAAAVLRALPRVMVRGAPLLLTIYSASGRANGQPAYARPREWRAALSDVGFAPCSIEDCTEVWRETMRIKHRLRWEHRDEILQEMGEDLGPAELSVTRAILGIGCRSTLVSLKRYEILALRR
jgi:SAM-dependent methyltransferase